MTAENVLTLKKGSTTPYLELQLLSNGAPVDLTAAKRATVFLKGKATAHAVSGKMELGAPLTEGWTIFKWSTVAGSTGTPDIYEIEVEVEWTNGDIELWPNEEDITVTILERVN